MKCRRSRLRLSQRAIGEKLKAFRSEPVSGRVIIVHRLGVALYEQRFQVRACAMQVRPRLITDIAQQRIWSFDNSWGIRQLRDNSRAELPPGVVRD